MEKYDYKHHFKVVTLINTIIYTAAYLVACYINWEILNPLRPILLIPTSTELYRIGFLIFILTAQAFINIGVYNTLTHKN